MNDEDNMKMSTVLEFKSKTISTLSDIINMVQCIIPIDSRDKKILENGVDKLQEFKNRLERAESLRELSEFIDINKLVSEYDSVRREVDTTVTYANYCRFMDKITSMVDNDI